VGQCDLKIVDIIRKNIDSLEKLGHPPDASMYATVSAA